MPMKPRRPCAYPGCPKLSSGNGSYCAKHTILQRKNYDRYERSPEIIKRYGNKWHKTRARYVLSHPLCEQCLKEGRLRAMDEVHHIVPVKKGGTDAEENLMSLCRSCHNKIHVEMGDR